MFQNLISFDVNESFASTANPQRFVDEALHLYTAAFWHRCPDGGAV